MKRVCIFFCVKKVEQGRLCYDDGICLVSPLGACGSWIVYVILYERAYTVDRSNVHNVEMCGL